MCADTEEDWGEYKNYVEKLSIMENREYPLAIGGAGIADLVEPMTQEVIERATASKPSSNKDLAQLLKAAIDGIYRTDLPWLVVKKQERTPEFLVCAKPKSEDFCIFRIKGRRLYAVAKKAIIGYGTAANNALLGRLYRDELTMSQAVVLAAYLVSQSKRLDEGVGGETSIAVVTEAGAYLDDREDVAELELRAKEVLLVADKLFLMCADIGLNKPQFEEKLASILTELNETRKRHLQFAADRAARVLNNGKFPDDPYPKFPIGGSFQLKEHPSGYLYLEVDDTPYKLPEPVRQLFEEERRKRQGNTAVTPSDDQKSEPEQ